MYIDYKGEKFGLCFENDYLDVLCFELGYEFQDANLAIQFKTKINEETGELEPLKDEKGNVIPILDNVFFKRFRDFLYSFLKASFYQKRENKGVEFPLSQGNITAIMMKLIADGQLVQVIENLSKANESFLPESKTTKNTVKKKQVGGI